MTLQKRLLTLSVFQTSEFGDRTCQRSPCRGSSGPRMPWWMRALVSAVCSGLSRRQSSWQKGSEPYRVPCLQQLYKLSKCSPRTESLTPCCVTEVFLPPTLHCLPSCQSLGENKDPQGHIMHRPWCPLKETVNPGSCALALRLPGKCLSIPACSLESLRRIQPFLLLSAIHFCPFSRGYEDRHGIAFHF